MRRPKTRRLAPSVCLLSTLFAFTAALGQNVASEEPQAPYALPTKLETWTGDLDGMVQRRMIRVLVAFSRTQFWVEKGKPQGMIYESFKAFEKAVNKKTSLPRSICRSM